MTQHYKIEKNITGKYFASQDITRNLHINDFFFQLSFNHKCHMWIQFALVALNKLHKISITKKKCGTKLQWQLHEDVTYMNILSIQISLRGIIILQLLLRLRNVVALFIYILFKYLLFKYKNKNIILYLQVIILIISLISTYKLLTHVITLARLKA